MHSAAIANEGLVLESVVTSRTGIERLLIGGVQGLMLFLLYQASKSYAWPATEHLLFAPLLLVVLVVPVLWMSGLGHLERRRNALWIIVAVAIIAGLGFYDVWHGDTTLIIGEGTDAGTRTRFSSSLLVVFLVAGFFIAHSLLLSATQDRRRVASYATHFEIAWKLIIQLAFSGLFVGALWACLGLGATLFMLVKLNFLKELRTQPWFAIPVTSFAFACALHITDVRPSIVRGIRSLLLVLLSWILPVATLIVVGFLGSLPATGLEPLWATKSATAVLLGAAATLVILINAAYQNGEVASGGARVIRFSARVAALTLMPIAFIAIYSLGLRVVEYGWTTDRIIAAACLMVACVYAGGYAWAACQRGGWLPTLAPVNVAAAYVILAILLALFTPVADPARISVNNQVSRLLSGAISADKFDFEYLKFHGIRYGHAALDQLKEHTDGAQAAIVREKAQRVISQSNPAHRDMPVVTEADLIANLTVLPKNAQLPESFVRQTCAAYERSWTLPLCLRRPDKTCDAYLVDLDGDQRLEVILIPKGERMAPTVMAQSDEGSWSAFGALPQVISTCKSMRDKLLAGEFTLVPQAVKDMELGGQRMTVQKHPSDARNDCPG